MPAPPVRLLTTIRSLLHFSTYLASNRAVTSIPPPAGYTTVYSIGAVGKSLGLSLTSSALEAPVCAAAGVTSSADRSARAIVFSFIDSLPLACPLACPLPCPLACPLACDAPSRRREARSTQASARYPDVARRS